MICEKCGNPGLPCIIRNKDGKIERHIYCGNCFKARTKITKPWAYGADLEDTSEKFFKNCDDIWGGENE